MTQAPVVVTSGVAHIPSIGSLPLKNVAPCYSLGPSPRHILAIRATANPWLGLHDKKKILLEYNLSTFQVITNTGCACATYNHRDSCVYYHHVALWLHVWILPQAIVCV